MIFFYLHALIKTSVRFLQHIMEQSLREQGWVRVPSLEDFQALCQLVYHVDDLKTVQCTVQSPGVHSRFPSAYTLGNPLEAMVFHNWMGSVPLYFQRIWWTPLEMDWAHPCHHVCAGGRPRNYCLSRVPFATDLPSFSGNRSAMPSFLGPGTTSHCPRRAGPHGASLQCHANTGWWNCCVG